MVYRLRASSYAFLDWISSNYCENNKCIWTTFPPYAFLNESSRKTKIWLCNDNENIDMVSLPYVFWCAFSNHSRKHFYKNTIDIRKTFLLYALTNVSSNATILVLRDHIYSIYFWEVHCWNTGAKSTYLLCSPMFLRRISTIVTLKMWIEQCLGYVMTNFQRGEKIDKILTYE